MRRRSFLSGLGAIFGAELIPPEGPNRIYSFPTPRIELARTWTPILQTDILAYGIGLHMFCEPITFILVSE